MSSWTVPGQVGTVPIARRDKALARVVTTFFGPAMDTAGCLDMAVTSTVAEAVEYSSKKLVRPSVMV